jgi:hypothetical protein
MTGACTLYDYVESVSVMETIKPGKFGKKKNLKSDA